MKLANEKLLKENEQLRNSTNPPTEPIPTIPPVIEVNSNDLLTQMIKLGEEQKLLAPMKKIKD